MRQVDAIIQKGLKMIFSCNMLRNRYLSVHIDAYHYVHNKKDHRNMCFNLCELRQNMYI